MGRIVQEAIEAGALGFSTSRTLGHRAIDGEPVPGTFAAEDELFGLGRAMARGGRSVFELAPMGAGGEDLIAPHKEVDWMCRLAGEIGMPVSFALLQVDAAPDLWRELMDASLAATERGAPVYPQVAGRPFGMLVGLADAPRVQEASDLSPSWRPRCRSPSWSRKLREPSVRRAILDEAKTCRSIARCCSTMTMAIQAQLHKVYVLGNPPNYEPTDEHRCSPSPSAATSIRSSCSTTCCSKQDGHALLMLPIFNYFDANLDAVREMFTHPARRGRPRRRRRALRHDLRRVDPHVLPHALGARPRARRQARPRVGRQEADRRYSAALRARRSRGVAGRQEGRRERHRPRQHDVAFARGWPTTCRRAGGGCCKRPAAIVATIVSGEVIRRDGVDTGARPRRRAAPARGERAPGSRG